MQAFYIKAICSRIVDQQVGGIGLLRLDLYAAFLISYKHEQLLSHICVAANIRLLQGGEIPLSF